MGLSPRWMLLAVLAWPVAHAQIYECTGADGSRVFADKKCGPDAKPVKSIPPSKRRPAKAATGPAKTTQAAGKAAVKTPPRTAIELQRLLQQCDAGDDAACKKWTMGGGPNLLREREKEAELACEAGSLADCEARYCRDGVTEDCRQRVLRTASLSGETWYLRPEGRQFVDGSTTYNVRCVYKDEPKARDITITCGPITGPKRCSIPGTAGVLADGFSRLDQAAASLCADSL
jgi:hypothetical protein